jgi:hypothetical protein
MLNLEVVIPLGMSIVYDDGRYSNVLWLEGAVLASPLETEDGC